MLLFGLMRLVSVVRFLGLLLWVVVKWLMLGLKCCVCLLLMV